MISNNPARFGVHEHFSSGHIMVLVCCVVLQDHAIKGLCAFMVRIA